MRIHRFFISQPLLRKGELVIADENLLSQWRKVLRLEEGERVVLFDGSGDEVEGELAAISKKEATVRILEYRKELAPARDVTLFLSLIKRDHFELVLEKATELGAARIVPAEAARSEKKGVNRERCEKILREAAEQSGRATVPVLDDPASLQDIFKNYRMSLAAFDPRGEKSAREYFNMNTVGPVGVLIGPEGGFTDDELALFSAHNAPIVTTGPTILRAETAAIVALALTLS